MRFDGRGELKPKGPDEWMNHQSPKISQTCPFSPVSANETELAAELFPTTQTIDPAVGRFRSAYVGHVAEESFRMNGSSGGMVSWVATELLRLGLIDGVAHVVAAKNPQQEGRFFHYRISRSVAEINEGAKSRYYPVEMSEVLKTIIREPGRYAVVGIPCFIKAVHLLRRQYPVLKERIPYTLGLFCGHMKSAGFVESMAWQMKVAVTEISKVEFRYKNPNRAANWYNAQLTLKNGNTVNRDWWNLADGDWGAGFFMNHACNFCDDVVAETADISFGDAWVEPYASDPYGTNVVVVRSQLMDDIVTNAIQEGRLSLKPVDEKFVEQTQAAGFRQRREGLAYRLTWAQPKIKPRKRVDADASTVSRERKKIYRQRYYISKWSHRMFALAKKLHVPKLYLRWAAFRLSLYYAIAYHRGSLREMWKRLKCLH